MAAHPKTRRLRQISDHSIGLRSLQSSPVVERPKKNAAAVALGRLGGVKGGVARATALSAKERSRIAKKAAQARWHKQ